MKLEWLIIDYFCCLQYHQCASVFFLHAALTLQILHCGIISHILTLMN